jgi:hypothetical protein
VGFVLISHGGSSCCAAVAVTAALVNVALVELLRDRGNDVDIFEFICPGVQHVVPS